MDHHDNEKEKPSGTNHASAEAPAGERKQVSALRVPFGLREGRLYSPSQTNRGKECGCVCPGCQVPLIANQGEKKRHYFSHYHGGDCVGGYESAVHLMAKQVIQDSMMVTVPGFSRTLTQELASGSFIESIVELPPTQIQFSSVTLEQAVEGLRPDIVGLLADGTAIHIEVYVTHAVSEDKQIRFSDKNMFELDLSHLEQDAVADIEAFEKEVLEQAPRAWIGCQLYNQRFEQEASRLTARAQAYQRKHHDRLQREQQQKREAEHRKQQIEQRRQQLRQQHGDLLKNLEAMVLQGGKKQRESELKSAAESWFKPLMQRYDVDMWPACLNVLIKGDWIFNVHRTMWQAYIYQTFILERPLDTVLDVQSVKRQVIRKFGLLAWAEQLNNLKYQCKQQGKRRGQWYGQKGLWFLDDQENRMIPSPHYIVQRFLESLLQAGLLRQHQTGFVIHCNNLSRLLAEQAHVAEVQHQARLDARRRAQKEPEEVRQHEIDRLAEARAQKESKIQHLISQVMNLHQAGHTHLMYCQHCCHYQPTSATAQCTACGHEPLTEVVLSGDYLASLPHRLRCAPGIYRSSCRDDARP